MGKPGLFVKYGMMTDDKFLEKANKFHIMEDADESSFYTLEEYRTATETLQKNKEGKLVILYTTNPVQQDSYIRAAQGKRIYGGKTGNHGRCGFYQPNGIEMGQCSFYAS